MKQTNSKDPKQSKKEEQYDPKVEFIKLVVAIVKLAHLIISLFKES